MEAGSQAELVSTVDRLREEVDGLRQAMQSRAIIEQAKGILMERYGCSADDAFNRLARLSQHANVRLADIASALVATSGESGTERAPTPSALRRASQRRVVDRWPREASGTGEFGDQIRRQGQRVRTRARMLAARTPAALLDAVALAGLTEHPPQAAALATVDVNGTVVVLASRGVPAGVAARWRSVPVDLPLPACRAIRTGEEQWWDGDERPDTLGLGLPEGWHTAALLPLGRDSLLALTWAEDSAPAETARGPVRQLAAATAEALRRLPTAEAPRSAAVPRPPGPAADPTTALLDVLFDPIMICEPVVGDDRTISDLLIRHVNPAAGGSEAHAMLGRRLLELFPESATDGLLAACLRVWETGAQMDLTQHESRLLGTAGRTESRTAKGGDVRVTRYRDGVLITWTSHG